MHKKDIKELLNKVKSGKATPEEESIAEFWLHQINQDGDSGLSDEDLLSARGSMWDNIQSGKSAKARTKRMWPRLAAAASIVLCLSATGYFLLKSPVKQPLAALKTNDILPGSNKAMLTLANGQQIVLSGTQTGIIAKQGTTTISKAKDGLIAYQANADDHSDAFLNNTVRTQRGGQYRLILSDGSHVWLNAASSITYPDHFDGNNRTVEITGEVYFEVTHNPEKPFRVQSKGQTIEVLGTHFDVNAYDDENTIKTTLLEGKVKVTAGGHIAYLQPGQQSQVALEGQGGVLKGIQNTDVDAAVAWKNGLFQFDKADVKTVMRQISRWYDVDVVYDGNIQKKEISGSMYRNLSAAKALELLSFENFHFKINGHKIIVTN
jgi:transmembrane sensor